MWFSDKLAWRLFPVFLFDRSYFYARLVRRQNTSKARRKFPICKFGVKLQPLSWFWEYRVRSPAITRFELCSRPNDSCWRVWRRRLWKIPSSSPTVYLSQMKTSASKGYEEGCVLVLSHGIWRREVEQMSSNSAVSTRQGQPLFCDG